MPGVSFFHRAHQNKQNSLLTKNNLRHQQGNYKNFQNLPTWTLQPRLNDEACTNSFSDPNSTSCCHYSASVWRKRQVRKSLFQKPIQCPSDQNWCRRNSDLWKSVYTLSAYAIAIRVWVWYMQKFVRNHNCGRLWLRCASTKLHSGYSDGAGYSHWIASGRWKFYLFQ